MKHFFGTLKYVNGLPMILVSRAVKRTLLRGVPLKIVRFRNKKEYYIRLCGGHVILPDGKQVELTDKQELLKYRGWKTYSRRYIEKHCPCCKGLFLFTHLVRESPRRRYKTPVYHGLINKSECFICREKQMLHYHCDTCSFNCCYGCKQRMQETTLDCPQCRHGMLPWGAHI